jgi:hypothetical protein
MVIRGLSELVMSYIKKNKIKLVMRHWVLFVCKSYLVAVPTALMVAGKIANYLDAKSPSLHPATYEENNLAARIIATELAKKFSLIEYGFLICLVVFSLEAINAKSNKDKASFQSAILFLVVAIFLTAFFYLGTLVAHTK